MSTVIKSVKAIPSWFDIRKYEALSSLDIFGWDSQIKVRSHQHWMLNEYPIGSKSPLGDGEILKKEDALVYANKIGESPIIPASEENDLHISYWLEHGKTHPYDTYSVNAMSAFYLYWFGVEADIRSEVWAPVIDAGKAENIGEATPEQKEIGNTPLDLIYKKAGVYSGPVAVTIDLHATDEQIVSDFRHWLTHFRKEVDIQAPSQNFTEKDFSDWVESGVIPYIDLKIWSMIEGCSITQNVLGQAIFPNEYEADTTDRIRRTTIPKAKRMLEESFSRALSYQATILRIAQGKSA